MRVALYDVQAKFEEVENDFYLNWPDHLSTKDLGGFQNDNAALATSIRAKLHYDYPKNHFEVTVYAFTTHPDDMTRGIAGGWRGKGNTASALYFDNWSGKNIHIRYKPKWAAHKDVETFYDDFKAHKIDFCWVEQTCCFSVFPCWDCSYQLGCCRHAEKLYTWVMYGWSPGYQRLIKSDEGYLFVRFGNGLRAASYGNFHITNDFNQDNVQAFTYSY
jgi:hypothetical protein